MSYEIRRWNDHGKFHYELWQKERRFVPWKMASKHKTEKQALAAMEKLVHPHYDQIEYYNDKGQQTYCGW